MPKPIPEFQTQRLLVVVPKFGSEKKILQYYVDNQEHLRPWEPIRSPEFLTTEYWTNSIQRAHDEWNEEKTLRLHLYLKETDQLIGTATFSHLERGPFQNCRLGASMAERFQGKGYMTEALSAAIQYVFKELNYHRIEAGHMLNNKGSGRVLEKLGFTLIGISEKHVCINGKWEDHTVMSLVNEHWKPES